MKPILWVQVLAVALAACAGPSGGRPLPSGADMSGIRIRGAAGVAGASFLVVGASLDDGRPSVAIVDFGGPDPVRRLSHDFEPGIGLRSVARIPGTLDFLVGAIAADGSTLEIVRVGLDLRSRTVRESRRYAAPAAVVGAGAGLACVPRRDEEVLVVMGEAGAASAAARVWVSELALTGELRWREAGASIRAPLDPATADPDRTSDLVGLCADASGALWGLATWSRPTGEPGGSAVYRLGTLDGAGTLIPADPASVDWLGLGLAIEAVAAHPSGRGAVVFGPDPGSSGPRAPTQR